MIDVVLREIERIRRVARGNGFDRLELVRWASNLGPGSSGPRAEFIADAAATPPRGAPDGDGLEDDLRMILGHQEILVTVMDKDATLAHDALIERGVTVFREAAG